MNIPIRCSACKRRDIISLARLGSLEPACCAGCGSDDIEATEDLLSRGTEASIGNNQPQVQVEGSVTAVDRGSWQADFDKVTQALESGGWIGRMADGFEYVKDDAPEDLVRLYRELSQAGMAGGFMASKTATSDVGEFAGGGFMQNLLTWLRGHHTDDIPPWFPKRWLTPEEIASGKWSNRGGQSGAYAFGSKAAAADYSGSIDGHVSNIRGALKGQYKVPSDLVDALTDEGCLAVWEILISQDIPPLYFDTGRSKEDAWAYRAHNLVTDYLINHQRTGSKTAAPVMVDPTSELHTRLLARGFEDGRMLMIENHPVVLMHRPGERDDYEDEFGSVPVEPSLVPAFASKTAATSAICTQDNTKFRCYYGHVPTGDSETCEKCKGKFRCAHGHYYRPGKTAGQKTAVDDGATDRCQYCGLPIKDVEGYGWIVYPASRAPSDEPERCFGNAWGHEPAVSKSGSKIPISIRAFITDVNDVPVENPNVFDDPKPTMTSDLMRCSNCFHEWKYSTVDPAQPVPLCPNCGSTATTPAGANGVAAVGARTAGQYFEEALPDDAVKVGTVGPNEKWETANWTYLVEPGSRRVLNVAPKTAVLQAKVAHKVTEVTIGILSTNPGMPFEAAQHLAEQTVRSYPKMVAQA